MTERLIGVIMAVATGMELAHAHWVLGIAMLILALMIVTPEEVR